MNVLFVSIDSLRRDFLDTYQDDPWCIEYEVDTTNLDRFAERATVFNTHYAGSLPCMPARREWLTGTQEFLWRPWGPIEPFDTTLPEALRHADVMTKLITDHFHYFQHGSGGYFEDFNGFEFIRGHENDTWKTAPRSLDTSKLGFTTPDDPEGFGYNNPIQYPRNTAEFDTESDFFAPQVFSTVADWLRSNQEWDEWFCYVDSFDVHEPFHIPEPYASMYTDEDPDDPDLTYWPAYGRTDRGQGELSDRELDFVRSQFAGKVTMVDRWFGRVLETIDDEQLWDDTMIIVTSDHGFFLGEHGWVGKPYKAPLYNVLAHTPLMIWHPEYQMEEHTALTAAVDIYSTVLDAFGVADVDRRHSKSLLSLLSGSDDKIREWVLYGYWGSSVNLTDGRYTYLHPCDPEVDSDCYSTQMVNPHSWFTPPDSQPAAESGQYLPYADCPVWRYSAPSYVRNDQPMLFDVKTDPEQLNDRSEDDQSIKERMQRLLQEALSEKDAPENQYDRLDLDSV
ncbi:sulfatase-like hydrolase/transferase [Halocatena marina]|nr:sulfatase-like hydrolase/transferase [Halocatena marina]